MKRFLYSFWTLNKLPILWMIAFLLCVACGIIRIKIDVNVKQWNHSEPSYIETIPSDNPPSTIENF